jgi:two-component system response regulator NreC
METGVRGYLLKEDSAAELLTAIDQIKRGKTYLSKRLLPMLPTDILDIRARKSSQPSESLSHRQCQVLKLVAEGKTSDEIGRLLHISARTVHRHRENIRKKLRIKGTPELVQYAITKGYLIAAEGVLPVL